MADHSSKPPLSLTAIKVSVFFMGFLIILGLGAIAAKLMLDSDVLGETGAGSAVIEMTGAGDKVVFLIQTATGDQIVQILDPETGNVTERLVGPQGLESTQ